jgi:acyl dehydratase
LPRPRALRGGGNEIRLGLTGRKSFVYRARVMTQFKTLTYEGLQVAFVKPVYAGDRLTVHGVVTGKHAEGVLTRVIVDVRCVNQDGATTAVGTASGVIR